MTEDVWFGFKGLGLWVGSALRVCGGGLGGEEKWVDVRFELKFK